MKDDSPGSPPPDERELERPERPHRRFTLADAIGRAGGDLLKGASPVPRRRQAEFEIADLLERHLDDADGALRSVLERRLALSRGLIEEGREDPRATLVTWLESTLGPADRLARIVREVDAEWGRIYGERPHFDREGEPADRDDPYTVASVRERLSTLLTRLRKTG